MRQRSSWLSVLPVLAALLPVQSAAATSFSAPLPRIAPAIAPASGDYPPATWVPADPANYDVADRPHDFPVDMIIIHDTETTYADAIALFQDPTRQGSAHYVVSDAGDITQMVAERYIAWHAGNYDFNSRAIGIEHEGFADSPGWYTTAMYDASARLSASICSRWGVPMDRQHVIGHSEVPDPNDPTLFGGVDHHTDPGPYWDWSYYMGQAQSYASALPSPPHMVLAPYIAPSDGGATISWRAARSCRTPIDSYKVVLQPGNIVRTLPGTTTSTTFTGLQNGTTYTFSVTASNPDGQDSLTASIIPSSPCSTPTLSERPASPAGTGAGVVFSATTSTCTNPRYRFWVRPPGGIWEVARDYSTASTFNWTQTGLAGSYGIEADVIQQTSSVGYDAVRNLTYVLNGCTGARLTTDWRSPQPAGTVVALNGSANCLGVPEYRFWVQPPGGSWGIVRDYSSDNVFKWDTGSYAAGSYTLEVDVRDQRATDTYETAANIPYVIGPAHCGVATLSASPGSPAATASSVTFTAGTSGCKNPLYRFWVQAPDGTWSVMQDYDTANTFKWTQTGFAGSYRVEVDVRDVTSQESYDEVSSMPYVLKGCSGARLTTDKASPQLPGAAIVLTGTASCPGTPEYRFWVQVSDGPWQIAQDYGSTSKFNWASPATAGTYGLEVDVRNQNSSDSYETVANLTYAFGSPPCATPTLSAKPASPGATGTNVTFTTATSSCPNPLYRFWVRSPDGPWVIK
ncbi:MAG TPA: N-acetylmuramoyl-L-alanine amidase [Candidatus Dormibacteraeota bacterium]|nr:N-acetylmuramoyl-L-alanine amidase [Candidatus Dormibacteraeota bacterium]